MTPGASRQITRVLVVLATLTGLAASAVLLVDYLRPAPVFCGDVGSGCSHLRTTAFATWAGIPTPFLGVFGFLVLGVLSLVDGRNARLAHVALSGLAAAFAAFLIAIQIRMGVFCRVCMVVDVSALILFTAALGRLRAVPGEPWLEAYTGKGAMWLKPAFVGAMLLAVAAPVAVGFSRPLPPPSAQGAPEAVWPLIEREMRATQKGRVTVVDFVDFECPFCRLTHEAFAPVLAKYEGQLRVVQKQVPLRSIHPHALDAARAACCGDKLGKGKSMADALFAAPAEELTPEGCERIAAGIGLEPSAFRACVSDPSTDARIEAEIADFKSSGGRGLPTIWIDDTKFIGAQDASTLEDAIVRALRRKS